MKRTLIVFYSRTGHVRSVARALAAIRPMDVEEIREPRSRAGSWGWFRSAYEAKRGKCPPILPPVHDVGAYDLVVLGTPVWASRVSAPMRSFLVAHAENLPQVALFCTMGGSGGDKVLEEMAGLCGKPPVATMLLRDADLQGPARAEKLSAFLERIA